MEDEPTYRTEQERKQALQEYFQAKAEISERYRTKVRKRMNLRIEDRLRYRPPYSI